MKLQNFAVVFIIIILPIALVLSVYTGNLIDVANKQAEYDSILLNSTYDSVRAYQLNTLNNNYESATNSKVRDINASINSFFNSLSAGLSSSGLGKEQLTDYVPAMLYTLYDGYYVYGTYDNVAKVESNNIEYTREAKFNNKQYGIKPYVYYSCEYADKLGNYDLIVNYTLDNYITVTGTYRNSENKMINIAQSGYYINYKNVKLTTGTDGPADFDHKEIVLYEGKENEVIIKPEKLGEYLTTYDTNITVNGNITKYNYNSSNPEGRQKYYNYIIYNDVKYYLDTEHIGAPVERTYSNNISFNMTYDGYPIFFLDGNERIYISKSTFDELKNFLGVEDDSQMYSAEEGVGKYRDVNAYYYYYNSVKFSRTVEPALKLINLGTATVKDENGNDIEVIASNIPYDKDGKLNPSNVIKTQTYHTNYTTTNNVQSHAKSTYDNPKVFELDDKGENDPELESSSFNRHRIDVIISSIESSLVTTISNFNSYIGGTYDYSMPVLDEEEWDRICNNITVVSFMQGLTIGNYKYYSSYAIVANTKVKDFISKESIFVQDAKVDSSNYGDYHNPRCKDYNSQNNKENDKGNNIQIVGYRNIDYDRQNCIVPAEEGENVAKAEYFYYPQSGQASYECVVNLNDNIYTTDELLSGKITEGKEKEEINNEIRRAYITALAREKGDSYKTYGFLNEELKVNTPLTEGEALYTAHYMYQDYNYNTNTPIEKSYHEEGTYTSTALVGSNIEHLNFNKNPIEGYKDPRVMLYDPSTGYYVSINDTNNKLKAGNSTDIYLLFDVDMNKTKELVYYVDYYLYNSQIARDELIQSSEEHKKYIWTGAENNLDVNIDSEHYFNGQKAFLVRTDPEEYVNSGHRISNEGRIRAHYSFEPQYTSASYTVRYHSKYGNGNMGDDTFKFYAQSKLQANTFTREGYMFDGWALEEDGEVFFNDSEQIVQVDAANMKNEDGKYYLDLYAIWVRTSYQVNYQGNGATSGEMKNSSHEFDVEKPLDENKYEKNFNVRLNIGKGSTNYYNGELGSFGEGASVSYDNYANEYTLQIARNSSKYSGLNYKKDNAVLAPGKTATISFEVYSDRSLELAFKVLNAEVGNNRNSARVDGSENQDIQFATIEGGKWNNVYFTYTNNSQKSIYDYSLLSVEDTSYDVILKVRNPRFEITNGKSQISEEGTEVVSVSSDFLGWTYNNKLYGDKDPIYNLTNKQGDIITMEAQWQDFILELPEIYSNGLNFLGWTDEEGNKLTSNSIKIDRNRTFNALWEDTIPPKTDIKVTKTTTTSLEVQTTITDEGSGLKNILSYTYSIRKTGTSAWTDYDGQSSDVFTFNNLDQNTAYDIKVVVDGDNGGNIGEAYISTQTIELTGELIAKASPWYLGDDGVGEVTVTFEPKEALGNDYYIEYRVGKTGDWIEGSKVNNIKHGQTVEARVTDGRNYTDIATITITDTKKPNLDIVEETEEEKNNDSILIEAVASDDEFNLGKEPKYTFYIRKHKDQKPEEEYKEFEPTTDNKKRFENLEEDTQYDIKVRISDIAGNTVEKSLTVLTSYTYKIIFNGNGATGGKMETYTGRKGSYITLPANQFTKSPYNFLEWRTKGSKSVFPNNARVSNLAKAGEEVTLYAVWRRSVSTSVERHIHNALTAGSSSVSRTMTDFLAETNGGQVSIWGNATSIAYGGCSGSYGVQGSNDGGSWYNVRINSISSDGGNSVGNNFSGTASGYRYYRAINSVNVWGDGLYGDIVCNVGLSYSYTETIGPPN